MKIWLSIPSFVAVYFTLFGFALMSGHQDGQTLIGAFFAALGITFFLQVWIVMRTKK